MKLEQLGIDPKTGYHTKKPLTFEESKFFGILWDGHVGSNNKISAQGLAVKYAKQAAEPSITFRDEEFWKREVREMQNHLLMTHDQPILSKAGNRGGYWIAETRQEHDEFYGTFRKRGMTGMKKAARGKQSEMADMVTQLSFEFEELVDKTEHTARIRPAAGIPLPVEVVDAFLEKMTQNPEKFADGLKKIRDKYGSVLLPRKQVEELKTSIEKVQSMVQGLGV